MGTTTGVFVCLQVTRLKLHKLWQSQAADDKQLGLRHMPAAWPAAGHTANTRQALISAGSAMGGAATEASPEVMYPGVS